jgi:ankyrin repeat protein
MNLDIYDMAEDNLIDDLNKLLAQGVNVNTKDEFGYTALHYAISRKNKTIAMILLEHGADVTIQDDDGATPLDYAAEYNLYVVAEAILKKDPQALNIEDKHGNQPLWTATFNAKGNYEMIKQFMNFAPDVNHKNKHGKSPLDFAQQINDESLVNLLKY